MPTETSELDVLQALYRSARQETAYIRGNSSTDFDIPVDVRIEVAAGANYIVALEAALTAAEQARDAAVESEQSMAQLGHEFCDEMGAPRTHPDGSKIGLWLRYGWVQGFRDGYGDTPAPANASGDETAVD